MVEGTGESVTMLYVLRTRALFCNRPTHVGSAVVQTKNAVCAIIKHSSYLHKHKMSLKSTPLLKSCICTCLITRCLSNERELVVC